MATVRQKVAFKEVVNGSTLTKAMKTANYSPETVKRTNKLTRTKGWAELVDDFISDKELLRVHKEGLAATRMSNSLTSPDEILPDYLVRHKYLDSGYKIKGRYQDKDVSNKALIVIIAGQAANRYGVSQEPGGSSERSPQV